MRTLLWAWRALLALARKRSTNFWWCAISRSRAAMSATRPDPGVALETMIVLGKDRVVARLRRKVVGLRGGGQERPQALLHERGHVTVDGLDLQVRAGEIVAIAGVQGQWSSDVWIANDGGFLVHSEAGAEGAAGTDSGGFNIVVDISEPNAAGPIEPPA